MRVTVVALSEFFPYGAPELLEGAPARMARSTMTASLAVALLVVAAGALLSRQVMVVIEPEKFVPPIDIIDTNVLQPPPKGPAVPPTEIAHPNAKPILVPVDLPKIRDLVEPAPPSVGPPGDQPSDARTNGLTGTSEGSVPPVVDPRWDEVVIVDEMPAQIRCKEPVYPDLARSAGVEGTVVVRMLVGLTGKVERAIIAPKGSVPMLDQAALDAALTCVFTPALTNGHPVKVWVSQAYRFTLHSAP